MVILVHPLPIPFQSASALIEVIGTKDVIKLAQRFVPNFFDVTRSRSHVYRKFKFIKIDGKEKMADHGVFIIGKFHKGFGYLLAVSVKGVYLLVHFLPEVFPSFKFPFHRR
jgi:hypothetical protein